MSAALQGFAPDWPAPPNVRAWVTERGGPSRYGTLNLATHVGDDASAVAANRKRLLRRLYPRGGGTAGLRAGSP